ncbi:shikimate kinase [Paracoccus sp. Z118]|nr:shikimate kinase [Paracoccus sp. Z118]
MDRNRHENAAKHSWNGNGRTRRMGRNIVLIGMMGAGKTAVGTELGRRLGRQFVDSDAEIEAAAAMSVSEIFARDGEAFFRDRETEVLDRLLAAGPRIVATGGGAWIQPRNRHLIHRSGAALWLNCDLETLWRRVKARTTRPLLQTPDPRGTLERLLAERMPVYATADIVVDVAREDTIAATADRVTAAIKSTRPDLLEPA